MVTAVSIFEGATLNTDQLANQLLNAAERLDEHFGRHEAVHIQTSPKPQIPQAQWLAHRPTERDRHRNINGV